MICKNCGNELNENATFCSNCGTAVQTQPSSNSGREISNKSNGFAIAALALGISALIFCWVPFLGRILQILAIVFGILGMKKSNKKGMAMAGIITGGIAFFIGLFLLMGVLMAGSAEATKEYYQEHPLEAIFGE